MKAKSYLAERMREFLMKSKIELPAHLRDEL